MLQRLRVLVLKLHQQPLLHASELVGSLAHLRRLGSKLAPSLRIATVRTQEGGYRNGTDAARRNPSESAHVEMGVYEQEEVLQGQRLLKLDLERPFARVACKVYLQAPAQLLSYQPQRLKAARLKAVPSCTNTQQPKHENSGGERCAPRHASERRITGPYILKPC